MDKHDKPKAGLTSVEIENIREKFCDIGLGEEFLEMIPKA